MMKITASPTFQWSSSKPQRGVPSLRPTQPQTALPDIKQVLLPSSLDVSFSLSYRR